MTFDRLIEIASAAYSDGLIELYHKEPDGDHGDTLAKFIVLELGDIYSPEVTDETNLAEAVRVMDSAIRQLEAVRDTLLARDTGPDGMLTDR